MKREPSINNSKRQAPEGGEASGGLARGAAPGAGARDASGKSASSVLSEADCASAAGRGDVDE